MVLIYIFINCPRVNYCVIFDHNGGKRLFTEKCIRTTILSDGRIVCVFNDGFTTLFNPVSKQFEHDIGTFGYIMLIVTLPDDRIAFVDNEAILRIYDFNTCEFESIVGIVRCSVEELRVKFELVK